MIQSLCYSGEPFRQLLARFNLCTSDVPHFYLPDKFEKHIASRSFVIPRLCYTSQPCRRFLNLLKKYTFDVNDTKHFRRKSMLTYTFQHKIIGLMIIILLFTHMLFFYSLTGKFRIKCIQASHIRNPLLFPRRGAPVSRSAVRIVSNDI